MTAKRALIFVFLLASAAACRTLARQEILPPSISPEMKAEIDTTIASAIRDEPLPGLSLGIHFVGEPYFVQAYGLANVESGIDAGSATRYQIGSITKTFTAAAVLQLVEQEQIQLDQPVTEYLAELLPFADGILVSHLLAHTSGLPNLEETAIAVDYDHEYSPAELLQLLLDQPPALQFEPGSQSHYSNLGYYLLGILVERVSGLKYGEYLQSTIFGPLGMESTGTCAGSPDQVAQGYRVSLGQFAPTRSSNLSLAYAAGGLCSSAHDLLLWYDRLSSGDVISPDRFAEMIMPVTLPDGTLLENGLGFMVGNFLGHETIGHVGRTAGFDAYLVHFAGDALTIVVLSNVSPTDPQAIPALIASIKETLEGG